MSESLIKSCWVLTEGIAGTENQCIGLAEALGVTPVIKRVKLRFPWKQLSPWLDWGHKYALAKDSDPIAPPWPDMLISSGRKSVGVARYVRHASRGKTFVVQIQDPRVGPKPFDLVVLPQHDLTRGENVMVTRAALHRITPQKLQSGVEKAGAALQKLPKTKVAVLIGGNSRSHSMTAENTTTLALQLMHLAENPDIGVMITASRRTGPENTKLLRDMLKGPGIYFWDGTGENPYFAMLALADYIIVTQDSVSMTSEALATGKPLYIAALEGGAERHHLFHKLLQEQGYTRPFTGLLEKWSYTPPDDTKQVAAEVRRRMKEARGSAGV